MLNKLAGKVPYGRQYSYWFKPEKLLSVQSFMANDYWSMVNAVQSLGLFFGIITSCLLSVSAPFLNAIIKVNRLDKI